MSDQWYYAQNGQSKGPVSEEQLRQLVVSGQIKPTDLVWKQGMADWAPASRGFPPAQAIVTVLPPMPSQSAAYPAKQGSPVDKRQLIQRIEQLRQSLTQYVLGDGTDLPNVEPLVQIRSTHLRMQDEIGKAKQHVQQLVLAKVEYAPLEKAWNQKKSNLSTAEAGLEQLARPLGKAACESLLAGNVQEDAVFTERLAVHRRIEELRKEHDQLVPPKYAGAFQKFKAKAQQFALLGQIKLEEMKIEKLETQVGKSLIAANREESVWCERTSAILAQLAEDRSRIGQIRRQLEAADAAVEAKKRELCATLGIRNIVNAKSLDEECRRCQQLVGQKEQERFALEKQVPDRLLAATGLPAEGQLGILVNELRQATAQLQPAGVFARIGSFFSPKALDVHVRVEEHSDGTIQLTPIYLVDGREVNADAVGLMPHQNILGYSVNVDDKVLSLRKQGATKLTKRKAAAFLTDLQGREIAVRSKAGDKAVQVRRVKPQLTLRLNPDDTLDVQSHLATSQGVVVKKPVSLEQLRQDEGWFVADGDLCHAEPTNTSIDPLLFTTGTTARLLESQDVPEFIKAAETVAGKLGQVEKNDLLKGLAIYGNAPEHRAKVDGNENAIRVSTSLVCLGKDRCEHEFPDQAAATIDTDTPHFRRVPEGWIEITPQQIQQHNDARKKLQSQVGDLERIEGAKIPEVLGQLRKGQTVESPWTVSVSEAVNNAHRLINTPADVEFRLNVVDSDGNCLLQLDPIYKHERFPLSHAESIQGLTDGGWLRRSDAWVKIDNDKCRRITAAIDALPLQPSGTGFSFPARQRERVIDVLSPLGSIDHSKVNIQEVKPQLTLRLNPDDTLDVQSHLATSQGVVVEKPVSLEQLRQNDGWFVADGNACHAEPTNTSIDALLFTTGTTVRLHGQDVPEFIKATETVAGGLGHVEKNDLLAPLAIYGDAPEHRVKVGGDEHAIHVSTSLVYQGKDRREHEFPDQPTPTIDKPNFRRVPEGWIEITPQHIQQHKDACKELQARIGNLEQIEGATIPEVLGQLRDQPDFASPWTVYFSEAVNNAHRLIDTAANVEFRLNVVDSDGASLLQLDPIYNHERFQLSHADSMQGLVGGGWLRRGDAWIKIDNDKCGRITSAIAALRLQPSGTGFSFPANQRETVIDVFSLLGSIEHSQAYADFLLKLADFDKIEDVPLPSSLRCEISLRTYQKHGYNWLAFLHRFGLNGVLADDMGLGKTLQTLAIIQRAKELGRSKFPSLIMCPTSVVRNWEAEAKKFFRECPVIIYTGDRREAKLLDIWLAQNGVAPPLVVTSYDIARRDYEELNRIPWLYVVVDEGHNIKNPDAQRTRAIKTINGQHKLALTGTPIQNNLEELWSLFDFVMPGYLGTRNAFRELYGRNGRVNWAAVRGGHYRLRDRINPFILRRLKENVAKDLPKKIVVDRKVELTPIQVALYKEVLKSGEYNRLLDEVDTKGVQRASVLILSMFTKLRAICNHPALANKQLGGDAVKFDDSGKLDCLQELMEEIIEGEHRALLFCQSTQMLDIIEHFFEKWEVTFLRLDGGTPPPRRLDLVNEFNGNEKIKCFLISTKAGGTGLNLIGADTVIFYDHDWNPANDNQAQDRAHRIGQTKPVTVYKLISKGTIEEKILERQAMKQTLADEIVGADEQGFKDLTKEELLSLFRLDESDD